MILINKDIISFFIDKILIELYNKISGNKLKIKDVIPTIITIVKKDVILTITTIVLVGVTITAAIAVAYWVSWVGSTAF